MKSIVGLCFFFLSMQKLEAAEYRGWDCPGNDMKIWGPYPLITVKTNVKKNGAVKESFIILAINNAKYLKSILTGCGSSSGAGVVAEKIARTMVTCKDGIVLAMT